MQVSLLVGLLIIVACFCLPVLIVYLICRFIDWQDERNRDQVIEIEDVYDKNGKWLRRITKVDGVPYIAVGFEEGGF